MRLSAARQGQRREDRDTEACAIESFNPERQHIAVKAQRQNGESGGGHRWTAEERHRDAVIHLLVRKQAQMRPAA